ncbi:hypothetical protein [Millisia brevis]|uniref:hypothetical protein n=1 Tax=Millisia brevis TaxID=264148 RepID=UPI00082A6FAF|nr:hypothetical protein [Millisia brevis]
MDRITAAVAAGRDGDRAGARAALEREWEAVARADDALHRFTLAHYLADLMDHPAEELVWDVRALDAVEALTGERAARYHHSLRPAGFRASLHLNLADALRRLGAFAAAADHLDRARIGLDDLGDDAYGRMIRSACVGVGEAIARRSTQPRERAPHD